MSRFNIKEIKVLNIAQPNAHNIFVNGKNVENRNMPSNFRGTIAIYGSKTYSKSRFEGQDVKKEDCTFGCILGFVDIVDCITESEVKLDTEQWFSGPYGYVFENAVLLETPIEISPPQGAVVWWTLTGDELQKCLNTLPLKKEVKPLLEVETKKDLKRPKSASRKLKPSHLLAQVIGPEPTSYKKSIEKLCDYLEENDLFKEINGENVILADSKIRKLFGKSTIALKEIKDVMLSNLHE